MSFHIKELILDGTDFSKYSVEGGNNSLPNLSKINVFVGANNSGKSRFLRQIATIETLVFVPTVDLSAAEQIRKDLASGIKAVATRHRISEAGNFVNESQGIRSLLPIRENEQIIEPLRRLVTKVLAQDTNGFTVTPDAELKPFDQNDYRDKPLGKFIEDSVLSSKKRRGSYQDKAARSLTRSPFAKEHWKIFVGMMIYRQPPKS